jgi:hypothetical protein
LAFFKFLPKTRELLLCQKRYVSLLNHIRSNCSIHIHIMLRPIGRPGLVIGDI